MREHQFGLRGWQKALIGFALAWVVGCGVEMKAGRSDLFLVVGALPSAIFSPTGLPILSYPEKFRSRAMVAQMMRSANFSQKANDEAQAKGKRLGYFLGALQVGAFYLPFLLPSKNQVSTTEDSKEDSNE